MKLFFAALIAALAIAAAAAEPMEEVDYVQIEPRPVASGEKIEVIEFFYYGCDACYRFEPQLEAWLGKLPADVSFTRIPALRRVDWVPLTRLYFALDELGELDRLHREVFRNYHESGLRLRYTEDLLDWGEKHGLERARFEQVLLSEGIAAKVQHARDITVAYGIRATPSLVVDGKFLTSGGMVGAVENLLPVVDGLIVKAREERAGK